MLESRRLAYLRAMGVTGWVPREALAHAAARAPAELLWYSSAEVVADAIQPAPAEPVEQEVAPQEAPGQPAAAVNPAARLVAQRRGQEPERAPEQPPTEPASPSPVQTAESGLSVAPFYLQLWLAGPCALLIEISDPGLEAGTSEHNLLVDILRAAGLPTAPRLLADFRWPLSRNPQVARSAGAASEALQVFMQARLEQHPVKSIGCFGAMAGLIAASDPNTADAIKGREQALDELGNAWFAPAIEVMLKHPEEKAGLWQLLKRVTPRWADAR